MLLDATEAVEAGQDPLGVDPASHRLARGADLLVPRGSDWRDVSKEATLAHWN
jgi:hypothetical protein